MKDNTEISPDYYQKLFAKTSWPAEPVSDVEELKEWLDVAFHDEDGEPMSQNKNFQRYVRKMNSLGWINALHDFGDGCKQTPLMYVLESDPGDWRATNFLLEAGADPNIRDSKGKPALFVMLEHSVVARWKTFHVLMESGANVKTHYAGKSLAEHAKELARLNPHEKLLQMMWDDMKRSLGVTDEDFEAEYY